MKTLSFLTAALVTLGAGLFYLSTTTEADEPAPQKTIKANEDGLKLNGSATRAVLAGTVKVYQVGLYVANPTKDEKLIFADRKKKRVQIKMLREVTGKRFDSTIRKNIKRNYSDAEQKKYSKQNEQFLNCFVEKILAKNSVVDIDFIPGKGTEILIDRKRVDLIPGDEYYHVLLRLWIGDPLQKSIKEGLLKGEPS
ncbi:MAG: hypothetical protein ACI9UA_000390 [Pseudoalteromonas tetraodonis]|jgi:hypothetical protein